MLQLLQLCYRHLETVVETVLVEEVGEVLALFVLTVGSSHPRCLGKQKVLQLLVLLELGRQRRLLRRFMLPLLKGGLGLRSTIQQEFR